jgi:hypothetical protein
MTRSALLAAAATTAAMLAAARPAHAMGTYITLEVVAWNKDGTATLVTRATGSSGTAGTTLDYFLVTATAKTAAKFTFFDTTDPDKATQHVDAKACATSADALAKVLADKQFTGVTADKAQCKSAARNVVTISADAARDAKATLVAPPIANSHRTATRQQTAGWAAAEAEQRDIKQRAPDGADVFAKTDALVLVLYGGNGDDSFPGHAAVYAGGKRVIEDLRSL